MCNSFSRLASCSDHFSGWNTRDKQKRGADKSGGKLSSHVFAPSQTKIHLNRTKVEKHWNSSDKEETKKGRLQNEKGKTGILVSEASNENRKTRNVIPETGNQIGKASDEKGKTGICVPETGNQKGKTGKLVSGLPFLVPDAPSRAKITFDPDTSTRA